MVDRQETTWKAKKGIEKYAEFGEVQVSQADTVTFSNYDSSQALLNVVFWKKSDGTAMTSTIALNVATITGAGTNVNCIYMAWGYKA